MLALATGLALTPSASPCRRCAGAAIDLVARSSAAISLVVIGGALVDVPRAARSLRVIWVRRASC